MARSNFESKYGATNKITPHAVSSAVSDTVGIPIRYSFSITPTWNEARIATYLQTRSILVVPVEPILMLDMAGAEYALVFYRDSMQQTRSVLQVYMSNDFRAEPNTSNFSGGMFQISMDGKLLNLLLVENGICQSKRLFTTSGASAVNRPELEDSPDPSQCPPWGSTHRDGGGFRAAWGSVVGFFSSWSGAGGTVVLDPGFGLPGTSPTFGTGSQNGGGGTNGNGDANDLQNEIDNNLFGASRSRLLTVVNRLQLTDVGKIRILIYDPLLVTQITRYLAWNIGPNGVKVANKHLSSINEEPDYKLFNEEQNYPAIVDDVLEAYITVPGECTCKTITYELNGNDVVITSRYSVYIPWWSEMMYGAPAPEIAIIPREHPNYDYLIRMRKDITNAMLSPRAGTGDLTWVYHLKKNLIPNPNGFLCKSCEPPKYVELLNGETYKFGVAIDRGDFQSSMEGPLGRYQNIEKLYLGITSFQYLGVTPVVTANMSADMITPYPVPKATATLIEKILIFNYILNSPQKAVLKNRSIDTKNGLPPGLAIGR